MVVILPAGDEHNTFFYLFFFVSGKTSNTLLRVRGEQQGADERSARRGEKKIIKKRRPRFYVRGFD